MTTYNSRTADKFVVRLPEGMRDQVSEKADESFMSMNSWIVQAINEKLTRDHHAKVNADALIRAVSLLERIIKTGGAV